MSHSLKVGDHAKGISNFVYYRAGNLYYKTADTGLEFPVPIEETDGASFPAQDKSLAFMRWIRSHLKSVADADSLRPQSPQG